MQSDEPSQQQCKDHFPPNKGVVIGSVNTQQNIQVKMVSMDHLGMPPMEVLNNHHHVQNSSHAPLVMAGRNIASENPSGGQEPLQQRPPSPLSRTVSSSSAFLLGLHTRSADLPEFVRDHQATLTFPEKLMLMLTYVEQDCSTEKGNDTERVAVSWIMDGRAFIIHGKDDLVKTLLPMFFRQGKFASFTRKLYRWGFRQVSGSPDRINGKREMIFGHELFQRDNKQLMTRMRSITAAGTRRALVSSKQTKHHESQHGEHHMVLEPKPIPASSPSSLIQPDAEGMTSKAHTAVPFSFAFTTPADHTMAPDAKQQWGSITNSMLFLAPNGTTYDAAAFIASQQPQGVMIANAGGSPNHQQQLAGSLGGPPNGYFASLTHTSTPGAFRDLQQGQAPQTADSNAYMRAAIDMLLRHASNTASNKSGSDC